MSTMRRSAILTFTALAVTAVLSACAEVPTAPTPQASLGENGGVVTVPLFSQFTDFNSCLSDQLDTYTFEGTARIRTQGDLTVLTARGTVTTSAGFAGSFNRTFLFRGDHVLLMRFHDMEVNSATGDRQVFGLGMYLVISPDGTVRVNAERYAGGHCVRGK